MTVMHIGSACPRTRGRFGLQTVLLAFFAHAIGTAARAQVDVGGVTALRETRLTFQENRGQWPEAVRFVATSGSLRTRVEDRSLALELTSSATESTRTGVLVRWTIEGQESLASEGERQLAGKHHYCFDGGARWVRDVPLFEQVRMHCVRDGIDWVLREHDGGLEYDLELSAGADLEALVIRSEGHAGLSIEDDGSLWIHTTSGVLRQRSPVSWEVSATGERRPLDVRFRLIGEDRFGFVAPDWDRRRELHIDPGLEWGTYLGGIGSAEYSRALDRDAAGNLVVAGNARSPDFPVTPGSFATPGSSGSGFFVCKFNTAGSVIFSTHLDVNWAIELRALALGPQDQPTVAGILRNTALVPPDFPVTPQAFDQVANTLWAGFVLRLSAQGDALVFSTFLENPPDGCQVFAIDVAPSGATIVGGSGIASFPTTSGAYDTTFGGIADGFVTRLSPDGSHLEWSTFLGGSSLDEVWLLELDAAENVTVSGRTFSPDFPRTPGSIPPPFMANVFFVSRISAQGSALHWSAVVGPSWPSEETYPRDMELDRDGSVVVVGETRSYLYPTTPGAVFPVPSPAVNDYNGYLFKIGPTGTTLEYASYLTLRALAWGVSLDASGVATVIGGDQRSTMPITPGAPPGSGVPDGADVLLCRIDPTGTQLLYSARLGGPNWEFGACITALDDHRVVVGGNAALGFPATPGAFDTTFGGGSTDGFLAVADLLSDGVQVFGTSTPACLGSIGMNTLGMPAANAPGFGFWCSGAPPNANGWLLVGAAAPVPSSFGGATIQIDRTRRMFVRTVTADARGFAQSALPLPALPSGTQFAAQYVFRNPPTCTGPGTFSASNALLLNVP